MKKDLVLEKYKNDGFRKNAFGWYFNPWIDEYDENYDPHNDEEYNEKLNKITKEIKWHPKLTQQQIEELIEEGLEPGDNEYDVYLWNHGINPFDEKEIKQGGDQDPGIAHDGDENLETKPKSKYHINFDANDPKGLATLKKGRFTRFMESHPIVRGIWEKVSKIGANKKTLLPIIATPKEEKITDDVTILDDDIIIIEKEEKAPTNNSFRDLLSVKTEKLIKRVDELLENDISEKDYDTNITAEEAIAKADKVLKDTENCK